VNEDIAREQLVANIVHICRIDWI